MTTATLEGSAPLESCPAPAKECLSYFWNGYAQLVIETVFEPKSPPQGAEPDPADRRRLAAAVAKAKKTAPAREAVRLAQELESTRAGHAAASERERAHQEAVGPALAMGQDPASHEEGAALARQEMGRLAIRLTTLEKLAPSAQRKAQAALQSAAEAEWRTIIAEHEGRRRELLAKLVDVITPLAAELLKVDEAEAALYHPHTGGLPDWCGIDS
jgi:hypothetical protein